MQKPAIMKLLSNATKYETLILICVIIALASVIAIWVWTGYRTHEMENEIYMIK